MAATFNWVLRLPVKSNGYATSEQVEDFLQLSDLQEGDDWMRIANDWGARQSPPIKFMEAGDAAMPLVGIWRE